jgi:ribonuclease HII
MREEQALWSAGRRHVAGVDEVGRGPLAGPVFAAAVVLDPDSCAPWLDELRDSKLLTAAERERLAEAVRAGALCFGIGWAGVAEIDAVGITIANRRAMCRAIDGLRLRPDLVLIDGPFVTDHALPQRAIVDGDALCASIAAASIIAKVARDALMRDLDHVYPEYGFSSHKGYATPEHLERLARFGPCLQHRRSWRSVQLRGGLALDPGIDG